ncbi:MAG: SMI1/KNR4 family protein, partial [Myxococcota bacterium]|nr:SMI1/KNR4 family protein [Myxococcota bacterium]
MQPTPTLETKQDPFHPLIEVTQRYRSDVHELSIAASEDAVQAAEDHLGHRLPPALGGFLRRWNGATLFRGALLIRGSAELAAPRSEGVDLVVFADGPGERAWAYAPNGASGWVFGELVDGELLPMHKSFNRWLEGTIRMLDEHVSGREEELMLRLECDPRSGWLLLFQGERLLESGEASEAEDLFRAATVANPSLSVPWQRLARILLERDPEAARGALKNALSCLNLPFPWSGARAGDPWLIQTLARLSEADLEGLEEELDTFLASRVLDVRSAEESALHVAAALEVSRARLRRGARQEAMVGLSRELERSRAFAHQGSLADLVLELAYVASDLGEHDEAERALREIRDHDDPEVRARGRLAVGRIAVLRHERWAEENLEEAFSLSKEPLVRARARLLLAQRYLLNERLE